MEDIASPTPSTKAKKYLRHGTAKTQYTAPNTLPLLWKHTKLNKDHTEDHPIFGKITVLATCWHWTGPDGVEGLGKVQGRLVVWVAWMAINGPVPDGFRIRNTCQNPLCFNPAHHVLGKDSELGRFVKAHPEFSAKNCRFPFDDTSAVAGHARKSAPKSLVVVDTPPVEEPKIMPMVKAIVPVLCRKGHDTNVVGWYVFDGGKRRECKACKTARHLGRRVAR
jgi:hypothetical protein